MGLLLRSASKYLYQLSQLSQYRCARSPQVYALDGFGEGLPTFLKTSVGSHVQQRKKEVRL